MQKKNADRVDIRKREMVRCTEEKTEVDMRMFRGLIVLGLASGLFVACGSDDDRAASGSTYTGTDSMVADTSLSNEAVDSNLNDAMETLADANISGQTLALALAASEDDSTSTWDRICEVKEGDAVVTRKRVIDRVKEKTTANRTFSNVMQGSWLQVRTWSKTDAEVACNAASKTANVDWNSDLTGYTLGVKFERSMTHTVSMELIKQKKRQ